MVIFTLHSALCRGLLSSFRAVLKFLKIQDHRPSKFLFSQSLIWLFLCLSHTASAQVLWLKGDDGPSCTTNNCTVTSWADFANSGVNLTASGTPITSNVLNEFNYNPAVNFSGTDHFVAPSGYADFTNGLTIFAAGMYTDNALWGRILDFGNGEYNSNIVLTRTHTTNDLTYSAYNGSTSGNVLWPNEIVTNQPYLFSVVHEANSTQVNAYSLGENLGVQTSQIPPNITRTINYIGRSNWAADDYFHGRMAEIIVYNTELTSTERTNIETYLALKYGMTMDTSVGAYMRNGLNLYSFDGVYDHSIAGIGEDADLHQRIGTSNAASNTVLIVSTTSNITDSNTDNNRTPLPDEHYVVWGHNNATPSNTQTTELDTSAYSERLSREWKITKTGTQNFDLFLNFTGLPAIGAGKSYKLLYSTTGDFSSGTIELNTQTNTGPQFQNISIPNGTGYFTVAVGNTAQTIYCPSGSTTTGSGYANSGTGLHKDEIFWLDWSCGGQTFPAGSTIIKSWSDGQGLNINGQITNISHSINEYATGDNVGDRLGNLYGGLNPIGLTPTVDGEDVTFDINFTATYNGYTIGPSLVVAEAQDTGTTTESITATTDGDGWQIIDRIEDLEVTFSNSNRTIFLDNDPNTGKGSALFHSANANNLELTLEGGGRSAAAIGFLLARDRGDAPISYGASSNHFLSSTISGGTQNVTDTSVNTMTLATISTNTNYYMGSGQPDYDASSLGNSGATGDDNDNSNDEDLTMPSLYRDISSYLDIPVTGTNGYLQGFADWNGDGNFTSAGDQFAANIQDGGVGDTDNTVNGTIRLSIRPPATATLSPTFIRFRWSSSAGLSATSSANNGEIEDYSITIGDNSSTPYTCETQNVALSGTGSMSSNYDPGNTFYQLSNINDGVKDLTQATTASENQPWITLDLGQNHDIASVNVRGRASHLGRFTEFYAFTSVTPFADTGNLVTDFTNTMNDPAITKFQSPTGVTPTLETLIPVHAQARYIRFQLPSTQFLEISEIEVNTCYTPVDRGDAPASYSDPTHAIDANFYMGSAAPDAETTSAPSTGADSDDTSGTDDDDTVIPNLYQNITGYIDVSVIGANGYLQGFADWDADGDFTTAGDQFATDIQDGAAGDLDGATNGVIRIAVQPPATASTAQTYLRLRWSTISGLDSVAVASIGEVEDYAITVSAPSTINCPAGSTSTGSGYASSGTGQYKNEIFWLDWSCGGQSISAGDIINKTWTDGAGLSITAQINTLSHDLGPYTTGTWVGDSLDDLYSGLNPIGLRNVTAGEDPSFVIEFSATLNGVSIEPNIVITDAEDSGNTHESLDVTTNGQSWQILESVGNLDATFFNSGTTISMNEHADISGGTIVSLSKNATSLVVDMFGGVSAVGFGVFTPRDHGDAPSSYESAPHLAPFNATGGSQPTTNTNNASLTNTTISNTNAYYIGTSAPDHDAGSIGNAAADGDDTSGTDQDETIIPTLYQDVSSYINVPVTGSGGYLQAFADWDADGSFAAASEQFATDYQDGGTGDLDNTANGVIRIAVRPPANASTSQTYLRLRWSSTAGFDSTTAVTNGEVEDYGILVVANPAGTSTCSTTTNTALSGTATQSSTFNLGVASRAIDNNTNGVWANNSVSHTNGGHHAWWTVDLGSVQQIETINIWNRTDCCSDRLSGFHLFTSDTPFPNTGNLGDDLDTIIENSAVHKYQHPDGSYPSSNALVNIYATGRYVRVQLPRPASLSLAEVQVNACAVTDKDRGDAPASYGDPTHDIDANFYMGNSAPDADTAAVPSAGADSDDTNGTDDEALIIPSIFQGKSSYINVPVSGTNGYLQGFGDWHADGSFATSGDQFAIDYQDGGTGDLDGTQNGVIRVAVRPPYSGGQSASFIRLRWSSTSGLNSTDSAPDGEVEDYAYNPVLAAGSVLAQCSAYTNVARGGFASQSSDYNETNYLANISNDGLTTNFSHTLDDPHEWWTIDLGSIQPIEDITIYNRSDCCQERLAGYHLFISDTPFPDTGNYADDLDTILETSSIRKEQHANSTPPNTSNWVVSRSGRYIRVQLPSKQSLNFAEMEVNVCGTPDRGDAPASYGEPMHFIDVNYYLGDTVPDIEITATHNIAADGDDNDDTGDEGSSDIFTLLAGSGSAYSVAVSGTNGYLQAWLDINNNGVFESPSEQVATDIQDNGAGDLADSTDNIIKFSLPTNLTAMDTYLRLRWSSLSGLNPTNAASDGEVEDYAVSVETGTPFTCSSKLYLKTKDTSNTKLLREHVVASGQTSSLSSILTIPFGAASLAYLEADNYLYTYRNGNEQLVRIDANANAYIVGTVHYTTTDDYGALTSTPNGNLMGQKGLNGAIHILNPNTAEIIFDNPNTFASIADLGITPSDPLNAYGVITNGRPIKIPLDGGTPTEFGPITTEKYSSAFADQSNIYVSPKDTMNIYRLNRTDGTLTLVVTGPTSVLDGNKDGAFCNTALFPGTQDVNITAAKSVAIYDPSASGLYALPGNDVSHSISVTNTGTGSADLNSIKLIDKIELENVFYNGDYDDGGPETDPVKFTDNNSGMTLTYGTDVAYSDSATKPNNFSECTYSPSAGYDENVRYICINPKGAMNSNDPDPSFTISYRARIQ